MGSLGLIFFNGKEARKCERAKKESEKLAFSYFSGKQNFIEFDSR